MKKENNDIRLGIGEEQEDVTKYGEFVSSYFAWLTLGRQKVRAEQLENMTKEEMKRK